MNEGATKKTVDLFAQPPSCHALSVHCIGGADDPSIFVGTNPITGPEERLEMLKRFTFLNSWRRRIVAVSILAISPLVLMGDVWWPGEVRVDYQDDVEVGDEPFVYWSNQTSTTVDMTQTNLYRYLHQCDYVSQCTIETANSWLDAYDSGSNPKSELISVGNHSYNHFEYNGGDPKTFYLPVTVHTKTAMSAFVYTLFDQYFETGGVRCWVTQKSVGSTYVYGNGNTC